MSQQPTVSVCIPAYNASKTIGKTIESVLNQTFQDFEIVVVDNASTDDTVETVKSYGDERIRVLVNDQNYGPVANFTKATEPTVGKYVKLLCADDTLKPTCLEKQVAIFEDPSNENVVLVASRRVIIDEEDKVIMAARGLSGMRGHIESTQALRKIVQSGTNPLGEPGAVLMRGDVVRKCLPWQTNYMIDVDMWARVLEHGDLYAMEEPLFYFRVIRTSWSHELMNKQQAQAIEFMKQVQARHPAEVSQRDVQLGSLRAWALMKGRRLVYRWLNFKHSLSKRSAAA